MHTDAGRRVRTRSRGRVRASSPLLRPSHTFSDSPLPTLYPRSLLHSQNHARSPSQLHGEQSDDRPRLPGPVLRSPSTPSTNTALGAQATSTTEGSRPRETAMKASCSASQTWATCSRCTCSSCVPAALAAAMRTPLIAASFSSCLTSTLASSDAPALRVLAFLLASMYVPFPYSTRAGVDAPRRFADECANILHDTPRDLRITPRSRRPPLARTASMCRPVTVAEAAPARGRLAHADAALNMTYV
jgi:hypothetical protein